MTATERAIERLRPHLGWLVAFALAGGAAALLGFGASRDQRLAWFVAHGAAGVTLALLAALATAAALLPAGLRGLRARFTRLDFACLAVLLVAYALLSVQVAAKMRVESDESLLTATSLSLAREGSPVSALSGVFDEHRVLHAAEAGPDARGLLFPLLLAWLHEVRGYAPENGFALNAALGFAALLALYAGMRRTVGPAPSLAAALLLLAQPLFVWTARSAGFDNASLLGLILIWNAALAAALGGRPPALLLLALLGVLATTLRSEAALAGAVAVGAAVLLALRTRPTLWHAGLAVVPLLFLPFAWQRAIQYNYFLADLGPGVAAFSVDHALEHLRALPGFLATRSDYQTLGLVLPMLGAGLAFRLGRDAPAGPAAWPAHATGALGVALSTAVILAYAWGDPVYAGSLRLFLPLLALLAVLAARGIDALPLPARLRALLAVAIGMAGVLGALPALRADAYARMLPLGAAQHAVLGLLRAHPACRPLVVERFTTIYLDYGYSALDPGELEQNWPALRDLIAKGAIDAVLLVDADWSPAARDPTAPPRPVAVPPGFQLGARAHLDAGPMIRLDVYALGHPEAPRLNACLAAPSR